MTKPSRAPIEPWAGKICRECWWYPADGDRSIGVCRRYGSVEAASDDACPEWAVRREPTGSEP